MTEEKIAKQGVRGVRQDGAVTIVAAVMILFLMTLMLIFAARSAIFDQRVSANETRQRIAFNRAEAAVDAMTEFIIAAASAPTSSSGWLRAADAGPWKACGGSVTGYCATPLTGGVGFYMHDVGSYVDNALGMDFTPLQTAMGAIDSGDTTATARVSAALQWDGGVSGDPPIFMVYGYGFSDCLNVGDADFDPVDDCLGQANVAKPLSIFPAIAGSPDVPLISKTSVTIAGNMSIVANPNAGGVGVPVTIWAKLGEVGVADGVTPGNGSWSTCEMQEWYGQDSLPDDAECPTQTCGCPDPSNNDLRREALSYADGNNTEKYFDILETSEADGFPADLFLDFFGVPRANYDEVKSTAQVFGDCSSLGPNSSGLIWITGDCAVTGNVTIGSLEDPVILVTAGSNNRLRGDQIFGVVFCTDVENSDALIDAGGGIHVFGAMIVDCTFQQSPGAGNLDLVYNPDVLAKLRDIGTVAPADGGWRDFDIPPFEPMP